MNFKAPTTQELDAIRAVCQLSEFRDQAAAMINNCWRVHVNPRADECGGGCSQTMERHRTIVLIASQRMGQWQQALAQADLDDFKAASASASTATKKTKTK